MKFKIAMVVLTLIFLVSLAGSAWSLSFSSEREGFASSDYFEPEPLNYTYGKTEPQASSTLQSSPEMTLQFSVGAMFEDYGGAIKVFAVNRGIYDLFLTAYRFEWVDTQTIFQKDVYTDIGRGDAVEVGILGIDGPPDSGEIEYRMSVKVLQNRSGTYLRFVDNNDDWIPFEIGTVTVDPLGTDSDYETKRNYKEYFDKANTLVTFGSPPVENAVIQSSQLLKTPDDRAYNYDKLGSIFDYVSNRIEYVREPEGTDIWKGPEESLSTGTGDCEDYSLLISAMVHEVGGTPRVILIEGHAFASIYIGNTAEAVEMAEESIMSYYDTDLKITTIKDELGYWLFADPLGSFYLGGLSVNSSPTIKTNQWEWSFDNTPIVYPIDITGESPEEAVWAMPVFWMTIMFISGVILIGLILFQTMGEKKPHVVEDCMICGEPVDEEETKCQYCELQLHDECSQGVVYCLRCGNMYLREPSS